MDEPIVRCYGWLGYLGDGEWRTKADNGVHRKRDHDGAVFSSSDGDIRRKDWKQLEEDPMAKRKIAFCFSVSIEMLQLLLRLGTFQLSDIFYNTVGGVIGGLVYYVAMKTRKRL